MYKETEFLELKQELTKDIKKEVVAFANSNGGIIYVGIDDDGKVIGLKNSKKDLEAVSGMIREGIKSDLILNTIISIENIDEKDVLVIKVMEGSNKPYYLADKGLKPSGVYIRHGNNSVPATDEIIKKLLKEEQSNKFEKLVSVNQELTFNYVSKIFASKNIEFDETKMKTLKIINSNSSYTNLGLLLSDQCTHSFKCAIYNGNSKTEFRDRREFNGSIFKQLDEILNFIDLINKTAGVIVGYRRTDTKDYPEYAIRESIVNAIIHRDYNFIGSNLIHVFDERIEILSTGGLVKGINLQDILNGISETRNPNLAYIFYRLEFVESFGTGIGKINESYDEHSKKPVYKNTENTFTVTLPNINYAPIPNQAIVDDIISKEQQLIEYLTRYNSITRETFEKMMNLSKAQSNRILSNYVKQGLIKKQGTGKNTIYLKK